MAAPVWILAGLRTPFAKAGGPLKHTPVTELGRVAIGELLARSSVDPARLDEVILGNCAQPAEAANSSRVAALLAGVPEQVSAMTVHRNCASGMEAVATAAQRIQAGGAQLVLAGGMESMSRIPLLYTYEYGEWLESLMRAKTPLQKFGVFTRFKTAYLKPRIALAEGLTDPVCGLNMGQTAEVLAREFRIDRERQDRFALESHQKAVAARERLREEIVPMFPAPSHAMVHDDVGPRDNQTLEALAKLKPYFDRKNGTVTVGNACQVTDGAVALLIGDEATARAWPVPPLGRIRGWAFAGLAPSRMGLGPVFATAKLLERERVALDEIELFEINEAFAAQVLACLEASRSESFAKAELGRDRALGEIPVERLNVNGGAIALGHPVGSSGSRLLLTTLMEMRRRGLKRGLASLCVGGGQGAAFLLEREG
ncbi:MAG: acetyl-CoA C-acyltransferase [Candidatus Eisenbacteria bacterium]|uniref:Acetyl-CoA C-acyltransferase n=1 Tax=Eiseniibacteriota bacterium TaxID=2212470 RepID=A0A849SKH9_UNCEI|nr:acetyl-CoA C-acyltransferase [Candidatus Eisenbacteria bacterium]